MNTDRLPGYGRTDVRVTYAFGGRWEVYGEIINLFNTRNLRQHVLVPSFPAETSNGVDQRVNVYETFPLMPSFGLRVSF
jgi:outer membrane receptor protein involved in Fe transport